MRLGDEAPIGAPSAAPRGPRHHSQPGAVTRAPLPINLKSETQLGIRRGHARVGYLTSWLNDSKVPP